MEDQGIMALPMGGMQAPTAQPEPQGLPPEILMAFEQARGSRTPEQISQDSLAAMQEADPGLAAQLTQQLQGMNLPIEVIDVLGRLVDYILANPDEYDDVREDILSDPQAADAFGELLPEEFDAAFFAGLNIALDQLAVNAASTQGMGVQQFAEGGIAALNPIAAQLSRMGRQGDSTLAHITPSEARLLRMRGGSGTINPMTGMPEFFLKKAFKAVGNAVKSVGKAIGGAVKGVVKGVGRLIKSVASSTIGRIVLTAAAFMIGGPMLASALGTSALVGGSIAVGLANTGMALASGAKFGDALKQGVIAGATTFAGGKLLGGAGGTQAPAPIENAAVFDPTTGITSVPGAGAGTSILPDVTTAATQGVMTPGSVSAVPPPAAPITPAAPINYADVLATGAPATPSTALGSGIGSVPPAVPGVDYGLVPQAGMPSYMQTPTVYGAPAAPTTTAAAAAAKPAVPGIFKSIGDAATNISGGQYMDAAGNLKDAFFGTPMRTGATLLAGTTLAGGFTPKQPEAPDLIPQETGYDLLRQQPDVYGTTPGGVQTVYAPTSPMDMTMPGPFGFQRPVIQMRPPQFPSFALAPQNPQYLADGGIAGLRGYKYGGKPQNFPRRNGQISGPGTEKSDSIPAMLSDGEFVMTAQAVRGAGNGSRREGAKRMYQMMHKLERMAS